MLPNSSHTCSGNCCRHEILPLKHLVYIQQATRKQNLLFKAELHKLLWYIRTANSGFDNQVITQSGSSHYLYYNKSYTIICEIV